MAHLGLGQRFSNAFCISGTHIHADMLDVRWIAEVRHHIGFEVDERGVARPLGVEQQIFCSQIVHYRDELMSTLNARSSTIILQVPV